jgi:hypothetical protein
MWPPVIFTKCHGDKSYLKSQKWLIWTKVINAWVGMDKIPCSEISQKNVHLVYS